MDGNVFKKKGNGKRKVTKAKRRNRNDDNERRSPQRCSPAKRNVVTPQTPKTNVQASRPTTEGEYTEETGKNEEKREKGK